MPLRQQHAQLQLRALHEVRNPSYVCCIRMNNGPPNNLQPPNPQSGWGLGSLLIWSGGVAATGITLCWRLEAWHWL